MIVENHFSGEQYGFREGRSTLDAINLVVNTAREAICGKRWKNGEKEYWVITTLDIENAYNSAKWNRIMEPLERIEVLAKNSC